MMMIAAWMVSLASCASDAPRVCHFESGRPCAEGDICLGTQGNECSYAACDGESGELFGAPVACLRGTVEPLPGGPFNCDPSDLDFGGGYLPPRAPCPLGALYSIEGTTYGACVPVSQCRPLPCDPAYGGDGCPIDYTCDAGSSTCVPVS